MAKGGVTRSGAGPCCYSVPVSPWVTPEPTAGGRVGAWTGVGEQGACERVPAAGSEHCPSLWETLSPPVFPSPSPPPAPGNLCSPGQDSLATHATLVPPRPSSGAQPRRSQGYACKAPDATATENLLRSGFAHSGPVGRHLMLCPICKLKLFRKNCLGTGYQNGGKCENKQKPKNKGKAPK